MNAKYCLLLLLFLAGSRVSLAQSQESFTPIVGWDKQCFPSFIIGTAAMKSEGITAPPDSLGDPNGLLGISLEAPADNTQIDVTIECPPFATASRFVGKLSTSGKTYSVYPKMNYDYNALSQCTQVTPVNVVFRVQLNAEPILEKTVTMIVRPVNDCPLKIRVGDQVFDRSFTFATYVNEQHPFTDKLLREALDIGVVDQFDGYQGKSAEAVLRQVYAIWDLLVARDVRYSSVTTTSSDSEHILSQNVRLLEDTINNQQANCVDGSVLFVSLLRKIDIESFLVLAPGHCYVGFYLDREHTKIMAIETTLLGSEVETPENVSELLEAAVEEDLRDEYSWASYLQALEAGTQHWLESQEKFKDANEIDYRVIDIAAARKLGVLPMPFRSGAEFLGFDHSENSRYAEITDDESEMEDEADGDYADADDEEEWNEEDEDEDGTEENEEEEDADESEDEDADDE